MFLCKMGHELHECTGAAKPLDGEEYVGEDKKEWGEEGKFIFVRLSVLREYLARYYWISITTLEKLSV